MLAEYRLKKKKDFDRVFKEGKGFKEDFLFLKFIPNNLKKSRFGIIVSQKISKKATLRNKIKRRIRAIISQKRATIKKGVDCILIAFPGLETKDFWEIEETINKIFAKAKILKNPNGARQGGRAVGGLEFNSQISKQND